MQARAAQTVPDSGGGVLVTELWEDRDHAGDSIRPGRGTHRRRARERSYPLSLLLLAHLCGGSVGRTAGTLAGSCKQSPHTLRPLA